MISQEQFEELVRRVINGEVTRKEISKEYHISERKINFKITELATKNPQLYQEFISKFPYRPKTITNINFVELAKKIIKEGNQIGILAEQYDISTKTINRRIKEMKNSGIIDDLTGLTQGEIYDLYIKYRTGELSFEDEQFIESMQVGTIIEKEKSDDRREYLEGILSKYYQYIAQGMSKAKAARMLGFEYPDMYKKEEELKRIETEVSKTELSAREKMRGFKKELEFTTTGSLDIKQEELDLSRRNREKNENATIEGKGEK